MSQPTDPELATRSTWTPEQTAAIHKVRALFHDFSLPIGSAKTPAQRAVLPRARRGMPPEGVHIKSVLVPPGEVPDVIKDERVKPAEVPCFFYSTTPLDAITPPTTKVVMYHHGGGNILGHPTDVQFLPALSAFVQKLNGGIICAPSYRCATVSENTFPANLQDVYLAYQYLLAQGYKPENITIGGDSSGGNLSIALTYLLSQSGCPMPARLSVFAPMGDLTLVLSDYARAQADVDIYNLRVYQESAAHYLCDPIRASFFSGNPTSPWRASDALVSSVFIPVSVFASATQRWPKTLIQVGTADMLIDSSRTLAERMREGGVDVELVEYPDVTHAFWVFPFFEEKEVAYERFAKFAMA